MLFQTFKRLLKRRAEPCSCGRVTITPAAGICGNHVHVGSVIPQIMPFWQQFWQAILSIRKTRIQISVAPP